MKKLYTTLLLLGLFIKTLPMQQIPPQAAPQKADLKDLFCTNDPKNNHPCHQISHGGTSYVRALAYDRNAGLLFGLTANQDIVKFRYPSLMSNRYETIYANPEKKENKGAQSFCCDPRNRRLFIGTDNGTLVIINYSGTELNKLQASKHFLTAICYDSINDSIFMGFSDGSIKSYEPKNGLKKLAEHNGLVRTLNFREKEKMLISSSWDHTIKAFYLTPSTTTEIINLTATSSDTVSRSSTITQEGEIISTNSSGKIFYTDLKRGTSSIFYEHPEKYSIPACLYEPEGNMLFCSCIDETIKIWRRIPQGYQETITGLPPAIPCSSQ